MLDLHETESDPGARHPAGLGASTVHAASTSSLSDLQSAPLG